MKIFTVHRQIARAVVAMSCMIAIALVALPAMAAEMESATLIEQMADCARLADPARRLNCYDTLSQAQQSSDIAAEQAAVITIAPSEVEVNDVDVNEMKDVPVVPPVAAEHPAAAELPRKKPLFSSTSDRPSDIQLTLIDRKKDSFGRWLFYFDNGQVWRQTEKGYVSIPGGNAVPATLSSGVLGSRNLRLGGKGKKVKVRRVR